MPADPPTPQPLTAQALRENRLFQGLSEETTELLARELKTELAAPGQLLIQEGEIASHMFVVLNGEMEVSHRGEGAHDVRVALLGPGDWVGEMAILEVQPRSATVRSLAPCTLVRLTASDVKRLLWERDPAQYALVVMNIARELSRRLRVADRVIANTSASLAQRYVLESRRPPKP